MTPLQVLLMRGGSGSGGGGSLAWNDVVGSSTGTPITKSNADETITAAGTMSFSYSGGLDYSVFKNGISQGAVTSLSVAVGHTVHFQFSGSPPDLGTFTISGLYNTNFTVDFELI